MAKTVYVVMRLDDPPKLVTPENAVFCLKPVSVWSTFDEANEEADRLNLLNGEKGCYYYCHNARSKLPNDAEPRPRGDAA